MNGVLTRIQAKIDWSNASSETPVTGIAIAITECHLITGIRITKDETDCV